ncbi:MAG: hypothetical protein RLY20_1460 [Verrucomicrobiota bacterium]|jgi:hypothetical protein
MIRKFFYALPVCLALTAFSQSNTPAFWSWAEKPVMGWNSWDCFATTVTEEQVKAQAEVMAKELKPFGWEYVTVDIQWFEPAATGFDYRHNATLVMDEFSRLLPAVNRFPSATNGAGFKPLADFVHSKGLKFGIHLLRGIPRQAVRENTAIKGTAARPADIANTNSVCPWNGDMFGVDMTKPGAQEYYNSLFELVASWGVDLVKVDDLSRPYAANRAEIEAIRKAIDRSGRKIVLSTSPGETPVGEGAHVKQHANMWRISDDFWDNWKALLEQFERCHKWEPFIGPGHFPDADMLPLGMVAGNRGGRVVPRGTRFTRDEQYTLMTLWSIARSPLIMGGDLTKLDGFTKSLLTNPEVIAVNQSSTGNRQLFRRDGVVAWIAEVPGSTDRYLALFNTRNKPSETNAPVSAKIEMQLGEAGFAGVCKARDLWANEDRASSTGALVVELPWHGAGLYRIAGQRALEKPAATRKVTGKAYLFTYFTNNGEDGLHLAWSQDGLKWNALKEGLSFMRPRVGESKLMRDPCVTQGPDGTFHMVWTTAWGGKTIGYASTKDFLSWTPQQALPVMEQEPTVKNCWAPEIIWDAGRERFLIFWASTIPGKFPETQSTAEGGNNHRIYSTTTKDFQTFTPTQLFYEPGFNVIDATMIQGSEGHWHIIVKDETPKPVAKKHLRTAMADNPEGPFGELAPPFTPSWVEGPTALRVGQDYYVYFDCYTAHHYGAMKTRDWKTWEDVTSKLAMPKGIRHGTAIEVEGKIIERLLAE